MNNESNKQTQISELIYKKINKSDLDSFAEFAQRQLVIKDNDIMQITGSKNIIEYIAIIFSQKVIPSGVSLNSLIFSYQTWHKSHSKSLKTMRTSAEQLANEPIVDAISSIEGMKLQEIAKVIDEGRSLSATAINQLIDKLVPRNNSEAKLSQLGKIFNDTCSDKLTKEYMNKIEAATIKAAGLFVDIIEQSRVGDEVTLTQIQANLTDKNYYDTLDNNDILREAMLLEKFVEYANDIDFSDDDMWKDIVMEMLIEDYKMAAIMPVSFGQVIFDLHRCELNILKSFQIMVANLISPPPVRGRPLKAK